VNPKLDALLAEAGRVARSDVQRAVQICREAVREAFAAAYPNADRGIALLQLALLEWQAGHAKQSHVAIARLLAFCARTGELEVFRVLQQYASLDDCRRMLAAYCPTDASVDETLGLLTGLNELLPARPE
jgi:hypothetical protein